MRPCSTPPFFHFCYLKRLVIDASAMSIPCLPDITDVSECFKTIGRPSKKWWFRNHRTPQQKVMISNGMVFYHVLLWCIYTLHFPWQNPNFELALLVRGIASQQITVFAALLFFATGFQCLFVLEVPFTLFCYGYQFQGGRCRVRGLLKLSIACSTYGGYHPKAVRYKPPFHRPESDGIMIIKRLL